MSNDFPKSGVSLEAQGAAKFVQDMDAANKSAQNLFRSLKDAGASSQDIIDAMKALGYSTKEIKAYFDDYNKTIAKTAPAEKAIAAANEEIAKSAGTAAQAVKQLSNAIEQQPTAAGGGVGGGVIAPPRTPTGPSDQEIINNQKALAEANKSVGNSWNMAMRDARGARDAIFAFGLALNLIVTEMGTNAPPAFKQAASSIKIVADAMLAGAYFGGQFGAVIGGVGGVLLALGANALSVDPMLKALNDTLDKLGKKDDAIEGLAKLAGVTEGNAEAALQYVKTSQDAAHALQMQVQAAQPAIPVLQGVGDAWRGLTDAYRTYVELRDKYAAISKNPFDQEFSGDYAKKLEASIAYTEAYKDALLAGNDAIQANIAGLKAQAAVMDGNAKATQSLADSTNKLATMQNYVNTVTARAAVASAQEQIDKLRLQGASADEVTLAVLKLAKAQDDLARAEATAAGRPYVSPILQPSDIGGLVGQQTANASIFNAAATKLGKDLTQIQQQYQADLEQLAADHGARMAEIDQNYDDQRERIARDFAQRIADINANLAQSLQDAATDYATRLSDLEDNANEQRAKNAQDYADRRAQIEQDYQDRVAQIQSDYAASLFDIVARDDAKGLVRARLQKEKALADAEKQREKDNAAAQKAQEKQEKQLADSLEKQKKALQQEYDRRVRELEQSAERQRAAAAQANANQLADLQANFSKQLQAEQAAYNKSQAELEKSKEAKIKSAVDTLVAIGGMSVQVAEAISNSLRQILDPTMFLQLTDNLQKAFDTQINIRVQTNTYGSQLPPQPGPFGPTGAFAAGGYVPRTMNALVHAKETVLPADDAERAYHLASQHMARIGMPMGSRGGKDGATTGIVRLYVDNSINSALLSSQIRVESIGVATEIVKRARG